MSSSIERVESLFESVVARFRPGRNSRRRRKSIGFGQTILETIIQIEKFLNPVLKYFLPNFIHVHYFYIIVISFILSVCLYGPRNMKYIDSLFMASGAATQAGLNTVDVNDLTLYQQLVLYLGCMISTPIFIHSVLVFVRLYWFERKFVNIKTSSKHNFKMRRDATMRARSMTHDYNMDGKRNDKTVKSSLEKYFMQLRPRKDSAESSQNYKENVGDSYHLTEITGATPVNDDNNNSNNNTTTGTANKTFKESSSSSSNQTSNNEKTEAYSGPNNSKRPAVNGETLHDEDSIRNVNPRDMYVSIAMMRGNNNEGNESEEEDGPALVIRGPAERDKARKNLGKKFHQRTNSFQMMFKKRVRDRLGNGNDAIGNDDVDSSVLVVEGDDDTDNDQDDDDDEEDDESDDDGDGDDDDGSVEESIVSEEDEKNFVSKMDNEDEEEDLFNREDDDDIDDDVDIIDQEDSGIQNRAAGNTGDTNGVSQKSSNHSESPQEQKVVSSKNIVVPNSAMRPPFTRAKSEFVEAKAQSEPMKRAKTMDVSYLKSQNDNEESEHIAPAQHTTFQENRPVRQKKPRKKPKRRTSMIAKKLKKTVTRYPALMLDDLSISESRLSGTHKMERSKSANYLSFDANFGRNSTFLPLNQEQKEELGGVEYRSLKLLAKILIWYYLGFHILALIVYVAWINGTHKYQEVVKNAGVSRTWWGAFQAASFFNDLGITLTPDSFVSFVNSRYVLLWGSLLIVIGNVGFPIMLRFLIWCLYKLSRDLSLFQESLQFLLDHPRRCFTLLFPSIPTWWLFFVLVALNAIDLILFCILDIHQSSFSGMSYSTRVLAGFFQAISTRTAGFSCVDLAKLHPAIQVSYMLMMYVSALPVAISIRRTNVYEEQSLGIYLPGDDEVSTQNEKKSTKRYIGAHLRKQLSFDLWYIFIGLFIICIAEGKKLKSLDDPYFTIFQVLFEVVSAYGCVGLSLGYPNDTRSFSAQFSVVSKLVIVAMFIRGRHRGLPYSIDRAIILPSLAMDKRDLFQAQHARRNSIIPHSSEAPMNLDGLLSPELPNSADSGDNDNDGAGDTTVVHHDTSQRPVAPRSNTITFNADTSFHTNLGKYQHPNDKSRGQEGVQN